MANAALFDKRILIVDDDSSIVEVIKACLRDAGFFNLTTAGDGKNALAKLRQRHIDLVLCDWNMPEMMGIDLIREIRANSKFSSLKILMVTGASERENVKEAVQCGVQGYIVKPFQLNALREKVISLLS